MEKKYLNNSKFYIYFLFLLLIIFAFYQLNSNHNFKIQIDNSGNLLPLLDDQKNYGFEDLEINTITPTEISGLEIFFNGNGQNVTVFKPDSITLEIYHNELITTIIKNEIPNNSLEIIFEKNLIVEKMIIKNESHNVFYRDIIFLDKKKISNIDDKLEIILIEFSDNPFFYSLATILFLFILLLPGLVISNFFKNLNYFYILLVVFIFFLILSIISIINTSFFNIIAVLLFLFFTFKAITNTIFLQFFKKNYIEIFFFIFVVFYLNLILFNIDSIFRLDKQFFLLFSNLKLFLENNFTGIYGYGIDISLPYLNSLLIYENIGLVSERANEIRLGHSADSFFSRGFIFPIFYQFFIELFGESVYVYLRFSVALIVIFLITLKRFFDFCFKKKYFSYLIVILFLISPNYFSYFNFIELYPKYFAYIFLVTFMYLLFFSKSYSMMYLCFLAGILTHSSNLLFMTSLLIIDITSKNFNKSKIMFYLILLITIIIFIKKKILINYFFNIEYVDIYISQSQNILNLFTYDISVVYGNFLRIILPGLENINKIYYINIFFKYSLISFLFFPFILLILGNDNYQKQNYCIEKNGLLLFTVSTLPIFFYLLSSNRIYALGGLSLTYVLFSILSFIIFKKYNLNFFKIKKIKIATYLISISFLFLYFFLFYQNITLIFDAKPDHYYIYKTVLICSYLILCILFIVLIVSKDKKFFKVYLEKN